MKTIIIVAALASLTFAAAPASAQNQSGAATSGMGRADSALRAKGDVKGAEQIERAQCSSGLGPCTEKDAKQIEKGAKQPAQKGAKQD